MKVVYSVDGAYFSNMGVEVSGSSGLLDLPKLKKSVEASFPDSNGKMVDLSAPRFDIRTITLDCIIIATTAEQFITRANAFISHFATPHLKWLTVKVGAYKELAFLVYLDSGAAIQKKWNEGKMYGTFQLKLIEPQTEKCIFRTTGGVASITLNLPSGHTNLQGATIATPYQVYLQSGSTYLHSEISTATGGVDFGQQESGKLVVVYGVGIDSNYLTTNNLTTLWQHLY